MRHFLHSLCGRLFTFFLCTAFTALTACIPDSGLAPLAGLPEYRSANALPLGHAVLHPAGGNLSFALPALVVDTPLGPQSFGATYNAASRAFSFSFYDLRYDSTGFLDPTGHWNSLEYAAPLGRPIPANRFWVPLDARHIKTAGGLVHEFDASDRLAALYRSSADHPRLVIHPDRIEQCAAPGSCSVLFEVDRDASGEIVAVRDRPGPEQRTATFERDFFGRLAVARSAGDVEAGRSGFQLEYSLLRPELLTATTNSEGERVEYGYDAAGRLRSVERTGGTSPTTTIVYGKSNELSFTRVIDPLGRERILRFDWMRQLREVQDGQGFTHRFDWTQLRLARHETPAGVVTRWLHTPDSTTWLRPSGLQITTRFLASAVNAGDPWQPAPLETTGVDASGAPFVVTSHSYDANGLLSATTDANGDVSQFVYADGLLNRQIVPTGNPGGETLIHYYDAFGPHGHPTEVGSLLYSFAFTEPQTFTSAGDMTTGASLSAPEAAGRPNIARLHYDADRQLAAIDYGSCLIDVETDACHPTLVGPDEGTTQITRRSDGRPLLVERPLGNDSQFVYDTHGELIERRDRVDGSWQSTHFSVDVTGAITAVTRPNGMRTEIDYNDNGWEREVRWQRPGSADMRREIHYADGRVVAWLDSERGELEQLSYDAAGRLSAVDYPSGERLELAYDARDRESRRGFVFPDASRVELESEYDGTGSWSRRLLDGAVVAEQQRIGGKRHRIAYGAGAQRVEREFVYSLPERGRLATSSTRNAQGDLLENTWITRDHELYSDVTRVASTIELPSGATSIYEVLWEEDGADGAGPRVWGDGETEIVPDFFGPERSYPYDALGNRMDPGMIWNTDHTRLQSAFGSSYAFDASGYVERIDEVASGDSLSITRNAQGRAIALQATGEPALSMPLDSFGRPLAGLFGGLVEIGPSGERSLDLGDLRLELSAAPCHLARFDDFRGNVRFTLDTCSGEPQKALQYDAYGTTVEFGSDGDDRAFAQGRQLTDDLLSLGARLYQPSTGRFLSPDPVFAVGSQFAYAEGNPVQLWDPNGAFPTVAQVLKVAYDVGILATAVAGLTLALSAATAGAVSIALLATAAASAGVATAALMVYLAAAGYSLSGAGKPEPHWHIEFEFDPDVLEASGPPPALGIPVLSHPWACGLGFEFAAALLLLAFAGPRRRKLRMQSE